MISIEKVKNVTANKLHTLAKILLINLAKISAMVVKSLQACQKVHFGTSFSAPSLVGQVLPSDIMNFMMTSLGIVLFLFVLGPIRALGGSGFPLRNSDFA